MIPTADLANDHVEIEEFRELLATRPAKTGATSYWDRARYAAGLTHGQAARVLGVGVGDLFAISEGRADPLPWFAERMREAYGLDAKPSAEVKIDYWRGTRQHRTESGGVR